MACQTLSEHDAVVFFPEDLAKVIFQELYAIHIPLFVPAVDALLVRQIRVVAEVSAFFNSEGLDLLRGNASGQSLALRAARKLFAVEPFGLDEKTQGHFKVWYWSHLSDFTNAPHITQFSGAADLLLQAANTDLADISQGMRSHYALSLHTTNLFFVRALHKMFGDGEVSPESLSR